MPFRFLLSLYVVHVSNLTSYASVKYIYQGCAFYPSVGFECLAMLYANLSGSSTGLEEDAQILKKRVLYKSLLPLS